MECSFQLSSYYLTWGDITLSIYIVILYFEFVVWNKILACRTSISFGMVLKIKKKLFNFDTLLNYFHLCFFSSFNWNDVWQFIQSKDKNFSLRRVDFTNCLVMKWMNKYLSNIYRTRAIITYNSIYGLVSIQELFLIKSGL